ncbi:MAG: hypothetical protein M0Q22_01030 [Sulfuritalea sp.]|jgi:hypothetical protein|nr:hypothetical protein [Sulfuritalea sp.]
MQRQKEIIAKRIAQLARMRAYLIYSSRRMRAASIVDKNLQQLEDADAEILAAFRARFAEYQEHLGTLLKAIALEEGVQVVGMTDVLAFAEKADIVESEQDWKEPRDVRNAINHEYEEDAATLSALASRMLELVAPLVSMNDRAERYCREKLGVAVVIADEK